jgi:thymidylate synthase (FAD)
MKLMSVRIIASTPNPEWLIAFAGKTCYTDLSFDELAESLNDDEVQKYVHMIMESPHKSVWEHVSFTFAIDMVSRALTHQLVRHRIASYSHRSQRYVNESNFRSITPKEIHSSEELVELFNSTIDTIKDTYEVIYQKELSELLFEAIGDKYPFGAMPIKINLIESGATLDYARYIQNIIKGTELKPDEIKSIKQTISSCKKHAQEIARSILPNACETMIVVTMNVSALSHFFNERMCMRAQDAIRELAIEMHRLCCGVSESIFKSFGAKCKSLGYCPENDMQHLNCKNKIITKVKMLELITKHWNPNCLE